MHNTFCGHSDANPIYFHSRSNHIRSSTGMGEETYMIWNGIDVEYWSQKQTLYPFMFRSNSMRVQWYAGYEAIGDYAPDWVGAIPLDIRYQSFTKRLDKAMAR